MNKIRPTFHYSLIQGVFWASYAAIFAYSSIYLLNYGFTNSEVGYVIAFGGIASAILQPTFGSIADRSKKNILHKLIIILSLIMIAVSGILLMPGKNFWLIAFMYGMLVVFLQVITPLVYSAGMFYIKKGVNINFGVARGIGSLAYAGLSTLLGILTKSMPVDIVIYSVIIIYVSLIILILLFHFKGVSEEKAEAEAGISNISTPFVSFIKNNRNFFVVLTGSILLFVSHNLMGNYMFQIVSYHGYTAVEMGYAVSLMAVMELPSLFFLTAINKRITSGILLKISGVFMFVKALTLMLATNMAMIYVSMCFQMLGYGLFCGISVYYVSHTIEERDQTRGQSLVTMTMTVGSVIGSLLGGVMLDAFGVPLLLTVSSVSALLGAVILCLFAKKGK